MQPESGDSMFLAGSVTADGTRAGLAAKLAPQALRDVNPDMFVVTHGGKSPVEHRLLPGGSSLVQKLYRTEQGLVASTATAANADRGSAVKQTLVERALGFLGVEAQAELGPIPNPATSLQKRVEAGRKSFFNAKFNGNGHTCATWHRENHNLTIDPAFIAPLPARYPLFGAENNPALKKNFEDPLLMRKFGLILENVDGCADLEHKFVMRGVPHTLALLDDSLEPSAFDLTDPAVNEGIGWGGDGAPGTGTLRECLTGAIVQHYPKTLGRKAGVDFRLATAAALDALEAFQKSLHRKWPEDLQWHGHLPGPERAGSARLPDIYRA